MLSLALPSPWLLQEVLHTGDNPSDLCGRQWPSWLLHSPTLVEGKSVPPPRFLSHRTVHFLPQFWGPFGLPDKEGASDSRRLCPSYLIPQVYLRVPRTSTVREMYLSLDDGQGQMGSCPLLCREVFPVFSLPLSECFFISCILHSKAILPAALSPPPTPALPPSPSSLHRHSPPHSHSPPYAHFFSH